MKVREGQSGLSGIGFRRLDWRKSKRNLQNDIELLAQCAKIK
jgi:hypothetical protein